MGLSVSRLGRTVKYNLQYHISMNINCLPQQKNRIMHFVGNHRICCNFYETAGKCEKTQQIFTTNQRRVRQHFLDWTCWLHFSLIDWSRLMPLLYILAVELRVTALCWLLLDETQVSPARFFLLKSTNWCQIRKDKVFFIVLYLLKNQTLVFLRRRVSWNARIIKTWYGMFSAVWGCYFGFL